MSLQSTANSQALTNVPIRFASGGFNLFGMAHTPTAVKSDVAIVLCHPYGEEKQYSYSLLKRFSDLLSERGITSFRFDCRGHGDSEGDLVDSDMDSLVLDANRAIEVARDLPGIRRVALAGLRYGATNAVLAARNADLAGIMLWSPIVDGSAYLRQLIRKHQFSLLLKRKAPPKTGELIELLSNGGKIEVEGDYLTGRMAMQFESLRLVDSIRKFTGRLLLSAVKNSTSDSAEATMVHAAFSERGCENAKLIFAEEDQYWESQAMYWANYPQRLYDAGLDWAEQL
jgi:pimeloyl-ACP methyl ester carboxylesterase